MAERWAQSYLHRKKGGERCRWLEDAPPGGIYDELCGLGPSPLFSGCCRDRGNKSWSYVNCDGCSEYTEIGVKIGSEDDGKVYCETCLKEALLILSGDSVLTLVVRDPSFCDFFTETGSHARPNEAERVEELHRKAEHGAFCLQQMRRRRSQFRIKYGGNDPDVWDAGKCEACDGSGNQICEARGCSEPAVLQ